ncbi:SDR family NAD(P)-dependent oxidoreductase [Kribbella antibiotica]|uniref:SDR family NAD(P)-dependent oxidoreductase n=1 Tax=Kribbella antibiotica TaxID=190195 RepID=A0A4R4ZR70_9ACTN|nr:NAD(P)H-binding protein [Kribbella antibiotica]TDD60564.1 SDR family NAD(P)-dependent oxidoreductase [Kribbella antibiotica]
MIIVTGATGRLGKAVVGRLVERMPAAELGVSVRDPEQAAEFAARGIRVRRADFDDPSALEHAFEGASQVLIVSGPADPAPHQAAIEAAQKAGAERILYTSHMGANLDSLFLATRGHAATEQHLAESGVPFTALRNGFYASTTAWHLRTALATGELRVPADGPVSWTAHPDLADAAVIALTDPDRLQGTTPALTGPEALDLADAAAIASELTGKKIVRVVIDDEDWRQQALARGLPSFVVDLTLGIFQASRRGEFAAVDPALGEILGRRPTDLRAVLKSELAS